MFIVNGNTFYHKRNNTKNMYHYNYTEKKYIYVQNACQIFTPKKKREENKHDGRNKEQRGGSVSI